MLRNAWLALMVSCAPADLLTQTSTREGSVDNEQPAVRVKPCLPGRIPVVTIETVPGTLRILVSIPVADSARQYH